MAARRERKLAVTAQSVRDRAQQLKQGFKASYKWFQSFMKRHNFSLRTPTVATSKLYSAEELQPLLLNFWREALLFRQTFGIASHLIGNMDEVPIYFELAPRKTIANKGAKTVVIKTSGSTRTRVTVILAIMADGA